MFPIKSSTAERKIPQTLLKLHCNWPPLLCGRHRQVYSCVEGPETAMTEEQLVVAVTGYPELYDFMNRNYHNVNKKQQAWRQVSLAIEMSGKLLSSINCTNISSSQGPQQIVVPELKGREGETVVLKEADIRDRSLWPLCPFLSLTRKRDQELPTVILIGL